MAELPAPLLSRQIGGAVIALALVAAVAILVLPPLGFWPLTAALVVAAIHQAFLALAILVAGRTGLAGRHAVVPVAATLGSAALLVLTVLGEIVIVLVAGLMPDPPAAWLPVLAGGLAATTGVLLTVFGVVVMRAGVVSRAARILPLVGGIAVLVAAVPLYLDPFATGRVALSVATLLLGGVGFALFTPRPVR